ncbi:histidine kinase [Flagellimonas sp. HMM57]|uniref:sensor histidine kinase n=1 Tax=unclassified Flagellimonas TaxID=2644544 RepID=UPI0013CF8ABC|nr:MULTISPECIES: histidine kinase [unclassified Flagellimonas]UII74908.1 histidine kinase [Flagellimonas sp. HMM57]
MELNSRTNNLVFWTLQFLGWGFLSCLSLIMLKNSSTEFLVFNVFGGMFIGIVSTSLLRYYLKHNLAFDDFGTKEIIKILLAALVASGIYALLNLSLGYLYHEYGPKISDDELQMLKMYDTTGLLIFSSLLMVFSWVICYLVIKLLLKLNKDRIERLELNTNLKQAQLNTLKGQINPHFMFNSLNNIRGLMLEDVERSREMLTKLSEILRYSLTKNNSNAISVEEELEMVDNYIDLSKIQFEDRLEFVKDVDEDTLSLHIPPMIIQLLIENAAKHGISNLKRGGRIVLSLKKEEDQLIIEVKNTGKLQIGKNTTQLGLKNIRQRLKLLYADKASFNLNEVAGEVVAHIKIPMV